ncbi:MAG TPA: hypothetical protein VFZ78_05585 [Flavisolibacter sp.]
MKEVITTLLLLLLLIHCQNSKTKAAAENSPPGTTIQAATVSVPAGAATQMDTTVLHADSAKISGETYTAIYRSNDTFYVLKANIDTILKVAGLHPNFEFVDFNGDGLKDIRINYMTNVPAVQDMLFFDNSKRNFRRVKNFSDFPDPNPVKGTRYYYSYHRSGCADMNWDSDLFYINNFKAIRIGNISGRQCDNRGGIKDGVYIHRVRGDKENLLKKLPIDTIWQYKDFKWGFIREYWTKNYKLFI